MYLQHSMWHSEVSEGKCQMLTSGLSSLKLLLFLQQCHKGGWHLKNDVENFIKWKIAISSINLNCTNDFLVEEREMESKKNAIHVLCVFLNNFYHLSYTDRSIEHICISFLCCQHIQNIKHRRLTWLQISPRK